MLDHLEEWLITFLMGAATLIIFAAVVHRYGEAVQIDGRPDLERFLPGGCRFRSVLG